MNEFEAFAQQLAREHARKVALVIEGACMEALVSGTKGVLVVHRPNGVSVMVTDKVPYGTIQERRDDSPPRIGGARAQQVIVDEIGEMP